MSLSWSRLTIALFIGVLALALLAGGTAATPAAQDGEEPLVESCAAEMPEDYADPPGGTTGTTGFVDGYWYDEPIDVDTSDGLSEDELEVLTARTAARAEALRCLTFETVPPVEVVTREQYANTTGEQYANVSAEARRFDNAMLSTMLFVGEGNDSVDARAAGRSQTVAGYYSIAEDRIVVIERPGEGSAVDETVLTHEVAHALQDQHFDVRRSSNVTMDRDNGLLGLIEGDASWVERRYLERCEDDRWAQSCVTLETAGSGGDGGGGVPNWGLYLEQYQPYSDGPSFVRSIYREDGGWAAVNATYDDAPESALYTMSPETFGEIELVDPEIENDSRGDWERATLPNAPDYERIGPAGIGAMVIAPSLETGGERNVVSRFGIYNLDSDDNVSEFDPLNYDQPPVTGWRGDRFAVFEDGNDTATVWRTAWADGANATEFADAYEELLEFHDAEAVDGRDGVYRFTDASDHAGAAAVRVEGDRVLIVTAPTTDALATVAPALDDADDGGDDDDDSGDGNDDAPLPGFGAVAALLATVLSVAWLARRTP